MQAPKRVMTIIIICSLASGVARADDETAVRLCVSLIQQRLSAAAAHGYSVAMVPWDIIFHAEDYCRADPKAYEKLPDPNVQRPTTHCVPDGLVGFGARRSENRAPSHDSCNESSKRRR